jgi:adenosylcobinamide kinase/adenosylcobinamide-phosphate guanylyltransferase
MNDGKSLLVLGGVRSGKSRLAEQRAQASGREVVYIATATDRGDAEMRARIEAHRVRRPAHWTTVEAPLRLVDTLQTQCAPHRCVLVDCLTLWLTHLLCADDAALVAVQCDALVQALPHLPGDLILVSNETGLGVVPLGALSRRFVDAAGELHQRLAARCDEVLLTVAGLPLTLKAPAP